MSALEDIKKGVEACRTYNFGMRYADKLAHEDADKLIAALEAVLNLANHEPRFRSRMFGGEYFPLSVSADEIIEVIEEALQ